MEEGEPCPIPSSAWMKPICRGGCFQVAANTPPEAVAAVARRALRREERFILSEWEEERPDGPSS